VARFIGSTSLLTEFQEIESGKKHTNRPALAAALERVPPPPRHPRYRQTGQICCGTEKSRLAKALAAQKKHPA
jgi:hypothetical protein